MAIAILQGVGGGKTPQQKSIKIIENGDYSVHSDEGYELERVDVSVDIEIEAQKKTLSVTKDGTYTVTPDDGYLLSEVTLNVDTPDVKPEQEKKLDITADGDYTVTPDSGYVLKKVSVSVNTPDQKVEQEKSLNVTADGTYTVTPDSGKVLSKVTFNVDTPDKIPEQTKTLDVTRDGTYTVKPDSGKVLSEVTVNVDTPDQKPEMVKTLDITSNGTHTLTPDAGYVFKGVTVNVAVPSEDLEAVISEQEALIAELEAALEGKASGGGGGVSNGYLPEDVAQVGYIQFTGDQLIDTGIVPNQDTKIKVVFTRESDEAMYLYGVASTNNTASVTAYLTSSGSWRFGNKSVSRNIISGADIIHASIVSKTGIDGASATASWSAGDFTAIGSLILGSARNSSGTIGSPQFIGKIISFEMWSGSQLVLKLIPVINADGIYGFYNTVGKKFIPSSTDVPFEGGAI